MAENPADDVSVHLTRRQEEIAGLVAQGLSNREIGERLFISERTVDGHLEELRNKLGMSSRAAITAWVVQRRLAAEQRTGQGTQALSEVAAPMSARSRRPIPALLALVLSIAIMVVALGGGGIYLLLRQPASEPPRGTIDTFAGTGNSSVTPDDVSAMAANIVPTGLAFDQSGQLYFVDGQRVRLIDRSGLLRTVAGSGQSGYWGDGGAPLLAKLRVDAAPLGLSGIVVDSQGAIYFSDVRNNRVRRLAVGSSVVATLRSGCRYRLELRRLQAPQGRRTAGSARRWRSGRH